MSARRATTFPPAGNPRPSALSGRAVSPPGTATTLLLLVSLLLGACASPTARLRELADVQGFERHAVAAGGFDLTVFENAALVETRTEADAEAPVLHVYLEGDGTPWLYRVLVMPDPTPRRPLMLRLMALDGTPAAYVGRPCYNGSSRDPGCHDALWTSGRYSTAVVDSMVSAVRGLVRRYRVEAVRFFGHSGGGALALLLAARVPETVDVVTIAGNLDPDAWTRHHGYSPLSGSVNPAREVSLGTRVRQWHLLGDADTVVPPELVLPFIRSRPSATGVLFPGFTHGCCWARIWPGVLRAVVRDEVALLPGNVLRAAAPRAVGPDDR